MCRCCSHLVPREKERASALVLVHPYDRHHALDGGFRLFLFPDFRGCDGEHSVDDPQGLGDNLIHLRRPDIPRKTSPFEGVRPGPYLHRDAVSVFRKYVMIDYEFMNK